MTKHTRGLMYAIVTIVVVVTLAAITRQHYVVSQQPGILYTTQTGDTYVVFPDMVKNERDVTYWNHQIEGHRVNLSADGYMMLLELSKSRPSQQIYLVEPQ